MEWKDASNLEISRGNEKMQNLCKKYDKVDEGECWK